MRGLLASGACLGLALAAASAASAAAPDLIAAPSRTCAAVQEAASDAFGVRFEVGAGRMSYFGADGVMSGEACHVVAEGTGEVFGKDFQAVGTKLTAVLAAEGWTYDPNADADGPNGLARGYRNGRQIALASVSYDPAPGACPADAPIDGCKLKPGQMLYTLSIDLAQARAP